MKSSLTDDPIEPIEYQQTLFDVGFDAPQGGLGALVSDRQLAAIFGVTDRQIRRLALNGIIQATSARMYPTLRTITQLAHHYRTSKTGTQQLHELQAIKLRMEIDEQRRVLVTQAEQEDWIRAIVGCCAQHLTALPARYAANFPEIDKDDAQSRLETIATAITDEIYKNLNNMKINNDRNTDSDETGGGTTEKSPVRRTRKRHSKSDNSASERNDEGRV